MQSLRDILRSSLRESLQALTPLDRLAAAWAVAAGHAVAERSAVVRLQGAQAIVEVRDPAWLPELRANTPRLVADLARIGGVNLTDILFLAAEPGSPPHNGSHLRTAAQNSTAAAGPAAKNRGGHPTSRHHRPTQNSDNDR